MIHCPKLRYRTIECRVIPQSDNIFGMVHNVTTCMTGDFFVHIGYNRYHFEMIPLAHFARELEAFMSNLFFVADENERLSLPIPDESTFITAMIQGDNVTFSIGTRKTIFSGCQCPVPALIREVKAFYRSVLDEIIDANPQLLNNRFFLMEMAGAPYIATARSGR